MAGLIGSALDLRLTGGHVVHSLMPEFCDASSVYLLERWLQQENAYLTADPPQIEARRLALGSGFRSAPEWERRLPLGEVVVFPRETPYARALATGRPQLLDAMDEHTSERLTASQGGDPVLREVLRSVSLLVVPLRLRDAAVGVIVCVRGPGRPPFVTEDAAHVEALAGRACVALDNARRYEHERRTALAIRTSLLPATAPEFEGCRIAHGYLPAGQDTVIGGDWFDVLPRPGHRVSLIVGDAMGHGPESAVAMIQLRTAVRTLAGFDITPAELMQRLDALACDTPGASFATCVYAEWDARRHTCTVVAAGHPPPLMRGPDRAAGPLALTSPGLPLGLGTGTYEPTVVEVDEPTLLVLYSDGLVESRHTDIDQGIARLVGALEADTPAKGDHPAGPADVTGPEELRELCEVLLREAAEVGSADDRTLLLAELTPATD
ncbi:MULTISPECIES: PP2C family protein-serine/threonine phosphatase [Streptomyces]|uniref:PP2C family protein-serine/threonine phosphatase n=1 Tax=Streptomyces TaxID=1883 RepID=UPI0029A0272D|nr:MULTISPECIES: SpoIIE family protein phosphatase [Streptomyces]MDX3092466.1 SpoIIE family protein phosphatase [Streptomyces sp. ME12-02E]MDX3335902.1 SpoIIE family protein phosphatase [Streptomyces sp. ME02-6978a]